LVPFSLKSAIPLEGKEHTMKKLLLLTGLLASVAGVASADTPQEERRDRAADRIEDAFERDAVLRRYDLDADSEGGRTGYIELEGKVQSRGHLNRALMIAKRTAPNYRIVNRIRVGR
jgi:osmotically-inducible protein OsmY